MWQRHRLLVLALSGLLAACGGSDKPHRPRGIGRLSGTVAWDPAFELAPGTRLRVFLANENTPRESAWTLSVMEYPAGNGPPASFELKYDKGALDPDRVYFLEARLVLGEQVLLQNQRPVPVLTRGNPEWVEVRLEPEEF